jgi:hypothetical protein
MVGVSKRREDKVMKSFDRTHRRKSCDTGLGLLPLGTTGA